MKVLGKKMTESLDKLIDLQTDLLNKLKYDRIYILMNNSKNVWVTKYNEQITKMEITFSQIRNDSNFTCNFDFDNISCGMSYKETKYDRILRVRIGDIFFDSTYFPNIYSSFLGDNEPDMDEDWVINSKSLKPQKCDLTTEEYMKYIIEKFDFICDEVRKGDNF